MDLLHIVLVVLVVAAVWAVVELALTIRKARSSLEEVVNSANETIAQVQPIITKADGIVDDLQPSVAQVPALLEKAEGTITSATDALDNVNVILGDVSTVSGVTANVTNTVTKAATSAVTGVAGAISKIGTRGANPQPKLEEATGEESVPAPTPEPARNEGYVVYGQTPGTTGDAPAAPEAE